MTENFPSTVKNAFISALNRQETIKSSIMTFMKKKKKYKISDLIIFEEVSKHKNKIKISTTLSPQSLNNFFY